MTREAGFQSASATVERVPLETFLPRPKRWAVPIGIGLFVAAVVVYWLSARTFDAGRPDLFYLADAFLHGRTWLSTPFGPYDVIPFEGHFYVPFPPFPALVFMPIVAIIGPATAHAWDLSSTAAWRPSMSSLPGGSWADSASSG